MLKMVAYTQCVCVCTIRRTMLIVLLYEKYSSSRRVAAAAGGLQQQGSDQPICSTLVIW
jgi:hypothetical protein